MELKFVGVYYTLLKVIATFFINILKQGAIKTAFLYEKRPWQGTAMTESSTE
jgi:hypothetical protein